MELPEQDWKHFRTVRVAALNRFCERVLRECRGSIEGPGTPHERYLALFDLLRARDRELADVFEAPRRSTAFLTLAVLRRLRMVTDDEWAGFSSGVRDDLSRLLDGR